MAGPRPSFLKRQKEQKRLQKAAEKREARQARRDNKGLPGTPDEPDYVDTPLDGPVPVDLDAEPGAVGPDQDR